MDKKRDLRLEKIIHNQNKIFSTALVLDYNNELKFNFK